MAVVPTQIPVSTSVPALTLAAGTTGGLAVASTIDPVNDYVAIYTASATATQGINRNTYLGITGSPVGTTDSQTLTNKTLTSPAISSPTFSGTLSGTYTIGGTPTFPSSVVTLTGNQTLTSKTLTSPTITAPTITNATISADALTGFTTNNTGTIYGLSVTGGNISGTSITTATIGSTALATNAVQANQLATNAITLASISSSTSQTGITGTIVILTGLTTTVTIPAGGRKVRIEVYVPNIVSTAISTWSIYVYNAATVTGSAVQRGFILQPIASTTVSGLTFYEYTPSAGSQSYCAAISVDTGTGQTQLAAASLAYLTVKVI